MLLVSFLNHPIAAECLNYLSPKDVGNLKKTSQKVKQAVEARKHPAHKQCQQELIAVGTMKDTLSRLKQEIRVLESDPDVSDASSVHLIKQGSAVVSKGGVDGYFKSKSVLTRAGYALVKKNIHFPGSSSIQEEKANCEKAEAHYKNNPKKYEKQQQLATKRVERCKLIEKLDALNTISYHAEKKKQLHELRQTTSSFTVSNIVLDR